MKKGVHIGMYWKPGELHQVQAARDQVQSATKFSINKSGGAGSTPHSKQLSSKDDHTVLALAPHEMPASFSIKLLWCFRLCSSPLLDLK